jgi:hypothetical protein
VSLDVGGFGWSTLTATRVSTSINLNRVKYKYFTESVHKIDSTCKQNEQR